MTAVPQRRRTSACRCQAERRRDDGDKGSEAQTKRHLRLSSPKCHPKGETGVWRNRTAR